MKRMFQRFTRITFWYEFHLNFTYWNTLKKYDVFNSEELRSIKSEYKKLKEKNVEFVKDIQSEYHLSWCCLIHSVYVACMNKGFGMDRSIEITETSLFENMNVDKIANYISKALGKSRNPFEYMVKVSKNQERNFFGSTFVFSRPRDDQDSYRLLVHNCMYNNYFRKQNLPELMQIACKWDMISWSKGIHPKKHKMLLSRPVTLGLNGTNCEFNFDRSKNESSE